MMAAMLIRILGEKEKTLAWKIRRVAMVNNMGINTAPQSMHMSNFAI